MQLFIQFHRLHPNSIDQHFVGPIFIGCFSVLKQTMSLDAGNQALPVSLLYLLSNSLILAQTSPYLGIQSLLALAATSKSFTSLVYGSPYSFRYLDLSVLKLSLSPQDVAVQNRWRRGYTGTYRTVDDYYSVALRWVFGSLKQRNVLKDVTTLVLDGLSVPGALLGEILCDESFNVRVLSIRECVNLSDQALMQVLKYIMRPSRPEGTPKLKGLYYFGYSDMQSGKLAIAHAMAAQAKVTIGVTSSAGAQLGVQQNYRYLGDDEPRIPLHRRGWYKTSGQILPPRFDLEWVQILQACSGVICFDAVLCRHNEQAYPNPSIATISLGLEGCQNCHTSPEGPAFAGESPIEQLPLLSPPPLHSSSVRAAQKPALGDPFTPPFFARCRDCLVNRWCERCNVWWCENCYNVPKAQTQAVGKGEAGVEESGNVSIKVHLGLCVQGCLMEELYHGVGEGGMWG